MPHWQAHVMQYKSLKQTIKHMRQQQAAVGLRTEEASSSFTIMLDVEVDRVNDFYCQRIEEAVIILHSLQQQVEAMVGHHAPLDQRTFIQRSLVSFHFNLLMLQNYVALNFTGLAKILKKFDKHVGASLRAEYLGAIVELPFYRCDVLGSLVEETEKQFGLLERAVQVPAAAAVGASSEACSAPRMSCIHPAPPSQPPRRVEAA